MKSASEARWAGAGVCAGLGLSFLALGLLWIGTPWHVQFLMTAPFVLAGYVTKHFGGSTIPVLAGLFPLGAVVVQFREKNESHAISIALVSAWVVATVGGAFLAQRAKYRAKE